MNSVLPLSCDDENIKKKKWKERNIDNGKDQTQKNLIIPQQCLVQDLQN